jgi:hypothetical protein
VKELVINSCGSRIIASAISNQQITTSLPALFSTISWPKLQRVLLNRAYLPLLPTKKNCWNIRAIVQKETNGKK